jgi:hypothetical protein
MGILTIYEVNSRLVTLPKYIFGFTKISNTLDIIKNLWIFLETWIWQLLYSPSNPVSSVWIFPYSNLSVLICLLGSSPYRCQPPVCDHYRSQLVWYNGHQVQFCVSIRDQSHCESSRKERTKFTYKYFDVLWKFPQLFDLEILLI